MSKKTAEGRCKGVDDKYRLTPAAEGGIQVAHTSLQDSVSLDVPSLAAEAAVTNADSIAVWRSALGTYRRVPISTLLNVPTLTARVDVFTEYEAPVEWVKPASASMHLMWLTGAGGGGGSGHKDGTGTSSSGSGGGGGGGCGAMEMFMLPTELVNDQMVVRVGAAGTGDNGQIDAGIGAAGYSGKSSQIGKLKGNNSAGTTITMGGGGGGAAGSTAGGGGGAGGTGGRFNGGAGGTGNENSNPTAGGSGGGGGAGGWESSQDWPGATGGGRYGTFGGAAGPDAGTVAEGASGGDASTPNLRGQIYNSCYGAGGGGGAGTVIYAATPGYSAGNGGDGGFPGGGGGAGAATTNGTGNVSGSGGDGAQGAVMIWTFF